MKTKILNTIFLLLVLSSGIKAYEALAIKEINLLNNESVVKCYDENTRILNFGIGLNGRSYYSGIGSNTYSKSPTFSLTYEKASPKKYGPGYLGVGAYVGYDNARYQNTYDLSKNYYYEHNWNYITIAARGVYHWDLLNFEKADIYGGALVGIRIQSYKYASNDPGPNANDNIIKNQGNAFPLLSVFTGARWYLAKSYAVYSEIGTGVSYFTVGLSYKF